MKECVLCGKGKASEALRVCVDCIRTGRAPPVLTATTPLVPFYVDDEEMENIGNKQLLL
jgi:hypothetical protein